MSITILNYHDQALIDQINAEAAERAAAKNASSSVGGDFSSTLDEASKAYAAETVTLTDCSADLNEIFEEAASTFGVSVNLLKSIARAESNFNPNAVSSAGAVGIMQLMPATAASLGVSNSYDPRENIMGGAKLISQLLSKYSGNTSLALAAYNAGSGNVDKYGGIPPFTETQNYVKKVLSYMNAEVKDSVSDAISNFLASNNVSSETVDLLVSLIKLVKEKTASPDTSSAGTQNTFTATVADGSRIINTAASSASGNETTDNTASGSANISGNVQYTPSTNTDTDSSETASPGAAADNQTDTATPSTDTTDASGAVPSTDANPDTQTVPSTDANIDSSGTTSPGAAADNQTDAATPSTDTTDVSGAVPSTDMSSNTQTIPSTDTSTDTQTTTSADNSTNASGETNTTSDNSTNASGEADASANTIETA